MSSFYGNGGYSSGGGGGSGEVISVNGKKGQVTLSAADVHALPDSTLIPSLDGFATEAWVNNQGYLTQHQSLTNYALKSEIPTVTNDFTDAYKDKVDSLWEDYQDAITALG